MTTVQSAFSEKIRIALAGQPNCGKSTVFNGLTGAKQYVANYPGVTVEKMTGWYSRKGTQVEVVDLPGTYSLTSYSPEERVSRDFLLHEKPSVVINVLDASNLKRSLYLTFQLLEMRVPVVMNLNMMDAAEEAGLSIDIEGLSRELGVPAVPTVMRAGKGKEGLYDAVERVASSGVKRSESPLDYPELESDLAALSGLLSKEKSLVDACPPRWLAVKLLEGDREAVRLVSEAVQGRPGIQEAVNASRERFEKEHGESADVYIARRRYQKAAEVAGRHVSKKAEAGAKPSLTSRIDALVCDKLLGPIILLGVIYALYSLAIVQGYKLTNYTWPLLAGMRNFIESFLPSPGFIEIPVLRALTLWFVDSINALLNYIPIFFILFGLIAILEDSGYMPRMAFIMDRVLSRFGLHGQSTLPMVLGGVVVGGCAVPGVMSTKGIPDERSRLATILTIPMLNCLAKVPLYILLINIYFADRKDVAMFFISTVSILLVLPVAKILTLTVLKNRETAPFIMEMPAYHIPTLRGVFGRAFERVWLYIRKITTVVAAVSVILFALLQFPGLPEESQTRYEARKDAAVAEFLTATSGNSLIGEPDERGVLDIILFHDAFRAARMNVVSREEAEAVQREFEARNPALYKVLQDRRDEEARSANQALRLLINERRTILLEMRQERIENSILGMVGHWMEPFSQWAGFNWRVNVAILSSLAAKESSVATLGSLYQQQEGDESATLEQRMAAEESGFSPLHALALMLFMVLCPPCFPTAIAVKVQTGSTKWMLFSFFYPLILGLSAAVLIFSGGSSLGLTGMQAMWGFYALALALTVVMGFAGGARREDEV
jgi:ferrous iron transport protein B